LKNQRTTRISIGKTKKTNGKHTCSLKNIEKPQETSISIVKPKKTKGKHTLSLKNIEKPMKTLTSMEKPMNTDSACACAGVSSQFRRTS
jgi:translation initiation factor 1 (eIF-1/SUI1)